MPTKKRSTRRTGLRGFLEQGPAWIQAVVAALGLVLSALVAIGLVNRPSPSPEPPSSSGAGAASSALADAPRVVLRVVREAPEVHGVGDFENLDLTLDAIYLLGIPPEGSGQEPVVVRGEPTTVASIAPGITDGAWEAVRPAPATGLAWQALIYPASLGAAGGLDDLKAHGAQAAGVKAASEIVQPTP